MKKNIFLVALILFTAVLFNAPSAKAENWDPNENYSVGNRNDTYGNKTPNNTHNNGPANNGGNTAGGPPTSNTALPINNGVLFLFVAGMAIGIVTLKKFKSLTPAMVVKL